MTTAKLTPELRAAIQADPEQLVAVEDDASHERFYLVPEAAFLHMQGLVSEQDEQCRQRLRQLIQAGIDSPDVPADQVFRRLRRLANELAQADA